MKQIQLQLAITVVKGGGEDYTIPWTGYLVAPGLAVCKSPRRVYGRQFEPAYRKWHVVHIESGWRLGTEVQCFRSRGQAVGVAEQLADLADWRMSADELLAIDGLREQVREVFHGI